MKPSLLIALIFALGLGVVAWFLFLQPEGQDNSVPDETWLAYGIELFEKQEFAAAIEDLRNVPAGSPHEAKARYYEGSAHMMLKDHDAAMASLEAALALNPNDTGTLYALGVVSYKLGNLKLAKGYFSSVLEINPNDEQAKGLMDIMAKLERNSVAEADEEGSTED